MQGSPGAFMRLVGHAWKPFSSAPCIYLQLVDNKGIFSGRNIRFVEIFLPSFSSISHDGTARRTHSTCSMGIDTLAANLLGWRIPRSVVGADDKGSPFPPRCSILSRFSSPRPPRSSLHPSFFCHRSISARRLNLRNWAPQTKPALLHCVFKSCPSPCFETVSYF